MEKEEIKVEIINPDVVRDLYKNHGLFACECYATPKKYAERVGKSCAASQHMSGSRCEYIKFEITGVDRGTAEQALRHEIGVDVPYNYQDNYTFSDYSVIIEDVPADQIVKNMASFRYIDKGGFNYAIPAKIEKDRTALVIYKNAMEKIDLYRNMLIDMMTKHGVDKKDAVQDANFLLPRATTTSFVIGFTPEALIHFCHKRLCTRAQEFIRTMAKQMKAEVAKYSPEFAKELVPHCQFLLWCPEGDKCCGAAPTKDSARELISARNG